MQSLCHLIRKLYICLAIVLLFLATATASAGPLKDGDPAPVFELKDLEGKPKSLKEVRAGKSLLLCFWATWWSPPCSGE